jgi:hypothetical protein
MDEHDPARRQQLMFQGNILVATHEQAGAQPFLEDVSLGPDGIAVRFVDAQVGESVLDMDQDLPARPGVNNQIIPMPLLSLDPGGRSADSFSSSANVFRTGSGSSTGIVDLEPMDGIESFRPGFSPSMTVWSQQGGGDPNDPDSLSGSGASSWPDWEERMNAISRLFEQYHTDPQLFFTDRIHVSLDNVGWLDPEARPGG